MRPSASITAALLWYRPAARRSNTGTITTTPACFATLPSASVLGPGTGSARSNSAGSSCWAKYCDRNSSGRQTSRAPAAAASWIFATPFLRLASGSADMDIWTSPTWYFVGGCEPFMGENTTTFGSGAHPPGLSLQRTRPPVDSHPMRKGALEPLVRRAELWFRLLPPRHPRTYLARGLALMAVKYAVDAGAGGPAAGRFLSPGAFLLPFF